MAFWPWRLYLRPMTTDQAPEAPEKRALDRVGIACLAWSGAFLTLTAVLSLTLK